MRKTFVIAAREYNSAVKTKAFLISLILMPIMMGGSAFFQIMSKKYGADITERKIAVIDRTPEQSLFPVLLAKAQERNEKHITDPETHRQTDPVFTLIPVKPSADDGESIDKQRLDISNRIRAGEYFACIELGKRVLDIRSPATQSSTHPSTSSTGVAAPARGNDDDDAPQPKLPDEFIVRYSSNNPTFTAIQNWASGAIGPVAYVRRMQPFTKGLSQDEVLAMLIPPVLQTKSLAKLDVNGKITYGVEQNQLVNFLLPLALMLLMFMIVMVGASPMTMNVMEEKQLRIAEVLLGSVRPFELMLGKLLGGVGVAMTLMAIYLGGAYWMAHKLEYTQYLPPNLIFWFIAFCIISVLMFGSMFVAIGSAVSNAKEAQSLITPVMLVVILPLMVFGQLIQSPSGKLAMIFGFFPPSAPMVTLARLAVPPGIPNWQPAVALTGSALLTILIVWCAGRIFRVGILMQGQGAKLGEMMKWIVRG